MGAKIRLNDYKTNIFYRVDKQKADIRIIEISALKTNNDQ